jgi:hypothetical protein
VVIPMPDPVATNSFVTDRQPQPARPVPDQLVEPPRAVSIGPAPPGRDRDAPRIGARPKGGYRPSRSAVKEVSGDVRSAGPYLRP